MSRIDGLLKAYARTVDLPWQNNLAGREKVWFCIYDPRDERRLRIRLPEFQLATQSAGHGWALFDLTGRFETWMASNEYHDAYFADPELLDSALDTFMEDLSNHICEVLDSADDSTAVAITGVGSLFGLVRVSTLIELVAANIRGRLVVFFPGTRDGSNYRLLDARDGWSYLAVPIEAEEKEA